MLWCFYVTKTIAKILLIMVDMVADFIISIAMFLAVLMGTRQARLSVFKGNIFLWLLSSA